MLELLTNKGLLISLLILLNLGALFLFKTTPRFVRGPIFVFLFLIVSFVVYRNFISPAILNRIEAERKVLETTKSNSPDQASVGIQFTDRIIWNKQINLALFTFASWQIVFVTLFAFFGLIFTDDKKNYLGYAIFFLIIGACVFYALNK